VIFSDLDGTFLDESSYSYATSLPAFRWALSAGALVVFCSSKTAAEIMTLQRELCVRLPFIAENGGGVFVPHGWARQPPESRPAGESYWMIPLGTPYATLVQALAEVRQETDVPIRGFSDMAAEEVAVHCGIGDAQAALAKQRLFDEPFLILEERPRVVERVRRAVRDRGLSLTRGGRFFHITGRNDKGTAVRVLSQILQGEHDDIRTIGIGDSANDLPMLSEVDLPILVQRPDGSHEECVVRSLPSLRCITAVGPDGWSRAVMELLADRKP
jgi:mannosyl-3-phosphoglycerate phosphatase